MYQSDRESLTTAEELLLLALDPRSGELRSHPTFRLPAALAGAALLDLFAEGSLTLADDRVMAAAVSNSHPYADALERIRTFPASHGLTWWVDAFGFANHEAKTWTVASLAEKHVIEVHTPPSLLAIEGTRYRLIEPAARSAVASKVLSTLRIDALPGPQATAITVLAAECGLVDDLVARGQRQAVGARVDALLQNPTGDAVANKQGPSLLAQIYQAVYTEGIGRGLTFGT